MTALEAARQDLKLHRQSIDALVAELRRQKRQDPAAARDNGPEALVALVQLAEAIAHSQSQLVLQFEQHDLAEPPAASLQWLEAATALKRVAPAGAASSEAAWANSLEHAFGWAVPANWDDDSRDGLAEALAKQKAAVDDAFKAISRLGIGPDAAPAVQEDFSLSDLLGPVAPQETDEEDTWEKYIRPILVGFAIATFTILAITALLRQVDSRSQLGQGPDPLAETLERKLLFLEQRELMRLALSRQWDRQLWDAVKDAAEADVLRAYLVKQPHSPAADLAKVRILKLEKPMLLALLADIGFTPRDLKDLTLEDLPEQVDAFYRTDWH